MPDDADDMMMCRDVPHDAGLSGLCRALERMHRDCGTATLVPHDYPEMAASLLHSYDVRPVKFMYDWQVAGLLSGHARCVGVGRRVAVLSDEAFRYMISRHMCIQTFAAAVSLGLCLGDPLSDMAVAASLDFPPSSSHALLSGLIAGGRDARDVLWFAWFRLLQRLVVTVDTCDESAINRVQRRISSLMAFSHSRGMF